MEDYFVKLRNQEALNSQTSSIVRMVIVALIDLRCTYKHTHTGNACRRVYLSKTLFYFLIIRDRLFIHMPSDDPFDIVHLSLQNQNTHRIIIYFDVSLFVIGITVKDVIKVFNTTLHYLNIVFSLCRITTWYSNTSLFDW